MNNETFGVLIRIINEAEEKRQASCIIKDCIINDNIGGNDIQLVQAWIDEVVEEYYP